MITCTYILSQHLLVEYVYMYIYIYESTNACCLMKFQLEMWSTRCTDLMNSRITFPITCLIRDLFKIVDHEFSRILFRDPCSSSMF